MKTKYIVLIFFLLGIITRFPFIEKYQSHWDGPQYSIAIDSYNLVQDTPSPPGYPIYIFLGWMLSHLFSDPHYSLLMVGVIFAGVSAAAFFLSGKYLFSESTGIIAALLYLSSPVYYFFGLTAYPYGMVSAFVLLVAVVSYRIIFERKKYGLFLGISYGIFCGVRPQDSLSLLPLVLFGFISLPNTREKIRAIAGFVISSLIWFAPLMFISGGISAYLHLLSGFLKNGALGPVYGGEGENIRRVVKGLFLTLGVSSFALTYYPPRIVPWLKRKTTRNKALFYLLWIIPALISVVFVRNDHSGYQMVYMTSLVLLASYSLDKFTKKLRFRYLIIGVVVLFNIFWFFRDRDPNFLGPYIQTSFHYSEIRKNDIELKRKISFIKENYDSEKTAIIVDSQHFRPIMYHLPDFKTISFSDLETSDVVYSCMIRTGQSWKRLEEKRCVNEYSFPAEIENIIFFENKAKDIVRPTKKVYKLGSNMSITQVKVERGSIYRIKHNDFSEL